jgi:hypothetical protein
MRARSLALALAAGAVLAHGVAGQDLGRRGRALEEEIRLAKTPAVYMVVDSGAGTISLKMKGMALKTWTAARMTSWGRPVGTAALKVERRSGWSAQDRINLTPGKKKEEKAGAKKKPKDIGDDVLELDDMPVRFRFTLEKGARLTVRAKPAGIVGRAAYAVAGLGRSLGRSMRLIGAAVSRRSLSEMRIILDNPKDAQEIFWAVPENTIILFI